MSGEDKLLPCPFCAAHLERSEAFSRRSADCFLHPVPEPITYERCPAEGVRIYSNNADSITAWNRRAPPPQPSSGEWVLVPHEPTVNMVAAFWQIKNTGSTEPGKWGDDKSDYAAYRAMLSAAPVSPVLAPKELREGIGKLVDAVVLKVNEYDDRTSPEDWPEALLITSEELHAELTELADQIIALGGKSAPSP